MEIDDVYKWLSAHDDYVKKQESLLQNIANAIVTVINDNRRLRSELSKLSNKNSKNEYIN